MVDKVTSGNEKMRQIVDDAFELHFVSLDSFDDFNVQSISNLVWGIEKADLDNKQVYDKLIDATMKRKDEFGKKGMENLLRQTISFFISLSSSPISF